MAKSKADTLVEPKPVLDKAGNVVKWRSSWGDPYTTAHQNMGLETFPPDMQKPPPAGRVATDEELMTVPVYYGNDHIKVNAQLRSVIPAVDYRNMLKTRRDVEAVVLLRERERAKRSALSVDPDALKEKLTLALRAAGLP